MSAGQSPVLPPSSGCCSPRPPEPGLARVPQGLPFMTNPCSRAPRSPFTAHPLFPSFPAIPISQIFPASAEVFCRVCHPVLAFWGARSRVRGWAEREEHREEDFPWGIQPGLAQTHRLHCPHPRAALAPQQPHGAPQNLAPHRSALQLPAHPALGKGWRGNPEPQGGLPHIP